MMLSLGWRKSEIKRLIRTAVGIWNPVPSTRSIERYLARARENLLGQLGKSREEHRAEAVAFLQQAISDRNASWKDRLSARDQLTRLLGLNEPMKIAPTTPDGMQPWKIPLANLSDEQLRLLEQIGAKIVEADDVVEGRVLKPPRLGNGNGDGGNGEQAQGEQDG